MAAIHETAYQRLKPDPTPHELAQNFLPTEKELALLKNSTSAKSPHNQLGFILSLKCYQCLGYHLAVTAIPKAIVTFIAHALDLPDSKENLQPYMQSKQRKRHRKIIRKYLGINHDKKYRKDIMKKAALKSSATKENLADIINDILEELIKNRFEIPAFSTLDRLARASRVLVSSKLYQTITAQLTEATQLFLDQFLLTDHAPERFTSGWEYLKQEMRKPSPQNVKSFIDYLEQLRQWREQSPIDLSDIPEHRLDQYVAEAMALDISDMRNIKNDKRYALSAMLLYYQYAKSLDSIANILIRWMRKMKNDASEELSNMREATRGITDQLVGSLKEVLVASTRETKSAQEKLSLIEKSLPSDVPASIEACDKYLIYANDNDLPIMFEMYQAKRSIMFRLLKQIEVQSASQDKMIENAIHFILEHQRSHQEFVAIDISDFGDLAWLDDQWFQFVTDGKTRRNKITQINKRHFEMAVFKLLTDEISCADAFIIKSHENDDPNKQLISWEEFYQQLDDYTVLINKPNNASDFVQQLQKEHHAAADRVNKDFLANEYLSVANGEPVLKKSITQKPTKQQENLAKLVASRMPLTDIVSVIADVEKWLNISQLLKPMSGYETKVDDYDLRFVATTFAYGCNVGPVQAERCLQKYSRKQIAWIFNHHITKHRLSKVSEAIIKAYKKFELSQIWGAGESASVDGTYWDMFTNNLLAEHHIRYGKYGGIGYYHVSDQYIALFDNFIPCGVYEAIYIFDGIFENPPEIQPKTIHGDTHAQNEVVFGFAYLLAITLMPRIRSFKHLKCYRPAGMSEKMYQHIQDVFTLKEPNWDLIESLYFDMLRVVMSIQSGKIKASTILKKLCSKSKKNKLHNAFRELGRVVRTIFLLNYIGDVELRGEIQAGTCRSEEFNDFIDWVAFGKDSVIHENLMSIQQKIIAFGRMTANALMFHTVANTTNILNDLAAEGVEYTKDDASILSAYLREHVNRYGVFDLATSNQPSLEFSIHKD